MLKILNFVYQNRYAKLKGTPMLYYKEGID